MDRFFDFFRGKPTPYKKMAAIDVDENDNDSEEDDSDENKSPAMARMPRNIVLEMTDVETDWG